MSRYLNPEKSQLKNFCNSQSCLWCIYCRIALMQTWNHRLVALEGGLRPCPLWFHAEEAGADSKLIQHGSLRVAYHHRHQISTVPVARITAHATVPGHFTSVIWLFNELLHKHSYAKNSWLHFVPTRQQSLPIEVRFFCIRYRPRSESMLRPPEKAKSGSCRSRSRSKLPLEGKRIHRDRLRLYRVKNVTLIHRMGLQWNSIENSLTKFKIQLSPITQFMSSEQCNFDSCFNTLMKLISKFINKI